jgi:preprotein translocase subunit SecE
MKNLNEKQYNMKDSFSWIAIALITVLALFASYYFNFSGPIKAVIWIGWLILFLLLGYTSTQGKQIFEFFKEAQIELLKVVWPTRQETVQTTSIVMVMVTVTGFVLWGIDSGMMWVIGKITHLG